MSEDILVLFNVHIHPTMAPLRFNGLHVVRGSLHFVVRAATSTDLLPTVCSPPFSRRGVTFMLDSHPHGIVLQAAADAVLKSSTRGQLQPGSRVLVEGPLSVHSPSFHLFASGFVPCLPGV